MGTAVYHLKVQFPENISETKFEVLKAFFLEGSEAGDFWQSNRGKSPEQFWPEFEKKFPAISEYLKGLGKYGKDCNNSLAGILDFGEKEDIENSLEYHDNLLTYHAEVWHFADWDPLVNFLKSHLGAVKTGWISDEYSEASSEIVLE
jgi:hypothetical protein